MYQTSLNTNIRQWKFTLDISAWPNSINTGVLPKREHQEEYKNIWFSVPIISEWCEPGMSAFTWAPACLMDANACT